jgi:predicted dehydrogenase
MKPPIRVGIIGMGGYAGSHHQAVLRLEEKHHARLVCTCDPNPDAFATEHQLLGFGTRGVRVFEDYKTMLAACAGGLDLLVVPTPIPLHAEMHQAGVEHGLAVYLEKPPTLDYVELEEMILHDRRAKKATLVGFNFIIEKPRQTLKERLLAGEFGSLREVHLTASWPRPRSYFERNTWAGRLVGDHGRLILDSCFGNAMAHYVHNALFWAGQTELMSWAHLASVRAELYRAHAIEGADTFFVEARTPEDAILRFALSHACSGTSSHAETIVCERATLRYVVGHSIEVRWLDGRVERQAHEPFDTLFENHLAYYGYLRGEQPRPATTLTDSRSFVILNDLAYVSSGTIAPIPAPLVSSVRNEQEQKDYLHVAGLTRAQTDFLTHGHWPGAHGWERPAAAAAAGLADLSKLKGVVEGMAGRS